MNLSQAPESADELVRDRHGSDAARRGAASEDAGGIDTPALPKLLPMMSDADPEISRMARRALSVVVRHAGRPGADSEARSVEKHLVEAYPETVGAPARRHLIWMLSEIGTQASVRLLAGILGDAEWREDARCALTRIPGDDSLAVLERAYREAPDGDDFKDALAEALVHRGRALPGFRTRKTRPSRSTVVGASSVREPV